MKEFFQTIVFFVLVTIALIFKPLIGLALAILFLILLWKKFFKPIFEIKTNFAMFYNKKIGAKNDLTSLDDIEEGLRTIYKFYENLENEVEKLNFYIDVLLDLPNDAIVIFDENGRIKNVNQKFKEICSKWKTADEVTGKLYWEVIRDFELNEFIKEALYNLKVGDKTTKEIEVSDKIYYASASKTNSGDIILLLSDISLQKELANIKRELIDNISHELKTPLSNIKGYIETIEDEIKNYRGKKGKLQEILNYIAPLKRNTERLIHIINDLLILSEIESGVKFEDERINFKDLLQDILRLYDKSLKDKGLTCEIDVSDELPEFWGDKFKLEQMLSNLIDNAIKYTEKGGIKIKIDSVGKDKIKISVEDTGIGIPKEHIPRIFERFYVVDKSRSRQLGGTGLGLSIVKHVVLSYGGEIKVESKVGVGTKFEILLPARKKG
jgi:two-component system phosphate regulon sensor histidine kinase PhoR